MDNRQILIIDDKTERLKLLETLLLNAGFSRIIKAGGADDGWVMMKQKRIDCVISAYEMSEMSGVAFLKLVRKEDSIDDTPIFLADKAFTKVKVLRAGQNGVTGLLVLPPDEKLVRQKILGALNKTIEPVIENAKKAYDQGIALIREKQYKKALDLFSGLVEQDENPEYYFNIGYIKTSQGRHGEAIEAFSMATRLDKLFAKAYEEMGRVYKLMGDDKMAEKYMRRAAEIYMDTNKIGSAETLLNELLESGTQSLNVFNSLGVLYRKKGDLKTALSQYKKALRVHKDEPYIYYNIGRLYLEMKEPGNARQAFFDALKKDPDFDAAKQVIKAIDLGLV